MAKRVERDQRRYDGFVWLARHGRRAEIVAYVTNPREVKAPAWMTADRYWAKIARDRVAYQTAYHDGRDGDRTSYRKIAAAAGVSYEMARNILAAYDAGDKLVAPDRDQLKLRPLARAAVTRDVIRRFDAGELNTADVARLIGGGANHRNAAYWVERMRAIYERIGRDKKQQTQSG